MEIFNIIITISLKIYNKYLFCTVPQASAKASQAEFFLHPSKRVLEVELKHSFVSFSLAYLDFYREIRAMQTEML